MDITRETARRVQVALSEGGHTVLAASEQTGIPRTTLLRRLTGTSPFTVDELALIAELIDVPLHSLVPDTDSRPERGVA